MLTRVRSMSALAVLAICLAAPLAAQQHYFGEDISWAGAGGAHPLSSAAQASFLAQLTGVGTENFESFAAGTNAPINLSFPGAGTATITGTGTVTISDGSTIAVGRRSVSGTQYYDVGTSGSGNDFTITFGSSVAAFGFFGGDIGEFSTILSMQFFNGATLVDTWAPPVNGIDGDLAYIGYINKNNPFTSVKFFSNGSQQQDFWAFDDMTIGSVAQVTGSVTPEPATMSLMATGLVGLVGMSRRRRKTA